MTLVVHLELRIYPRIIKKFKWSLWDTQELGGNWFMKKPEVKILVALSFLTGCTYRWWRSGWVRRPAAPRSSTALTSPTGWAQTKCSLRWHGILKDKGDVLQNFFTCITFRKGFGVFFTIIRGFRTFPDNLHVGCHDGQSFGFMCVWYIKFPADRVLKRLMFLRASNRVQGSDFNDNSVRNYNLQCPVIHNFKNIYWMAFERYLSSGIPWVGPQQKYSFPGTIKKSSYLILRFFACFF